jgi:hypothetical protein
VPQVQSERGVGFLLDVANQHGDGGLSRILQKVTAGHQLAESDLLAAVAAESIALVRAKFGDASAEARATEDRRNAFRTTPLLSDAPIVVA